MAPIAVMPTAKLGTGVIALARRGPKPNEHRADLLAACANLLETVTGRTPLTSPAAGLQPRVGPRNGRANFSRAASARLIANITQLMLIPACPAKRRSYRSRCSGAPADQHHNQSPRLAAVYTLP